MEPYIGTGKIITFAFHFFHLKTFSGKVIFSLFKSESESKKKVKKSLFKSESESEKSEKNTFPEKVLK